MNTFNYDPLGRRIEKSSSAATSVFAYDGDNLIEEANSSGTVVARYARTQNIDEPIAMLRSSATSYYEADGLGSITSLTSSSGATAETYTYNSLVNLTNSSGSLVSPFQYTGREFDSETGLYYYRARYYDPAAGRFLSEDPFRFSAGINFYAYVENEPIGLLDPYGLQCIQPAQKQSAQHQQYLQDLQQHNQQMADKLSPKGPAVGSPEYINQVSSQVSAESTAGEKYILAAVAALKSAVVALVVAPEVAAAYTATNVAMAAHPGGWHSL
jgi:RHS repeat-associated protein